MEDKNILHHFQAITPTKSVPSFENHLELLNPSYYNELSDFSGNYSKVLETPGWTELLGDCIAQACLCEFHYS